MIFQLSYAGEPEGEDDDGPNDATTNPTWTPVGDTSGEVQRSSNEKNEECAESTGPDCNAGEQ